MFRNTKVKIVFILIYVVVLGLVSAKLLAIQQSNALEGLMDTTFISPLGDPVFSLVKTVDTASPQSGDEIVYTLTYSNTRMGSQAYNVRLYDFMPAGVQFVSSNPPPASYNNGALLFTAPSITSSIGAPQNTQQVTIRVRVLEGYDGLYNHALVQADCVTPTLSSLAKSVEQPSTSLKLTKLGYSAALVNTPLVYTLRTRNTSSIPVDDATLIDILPTGLPLNSDSLAPTLATLPLLRWSLGKLDPTEARIVVITTTAPSYAGIITNTALVDARQRLVTETLLATQVVTEGGTLRVTKQGPAEVDLGNQLVYKINYWNAGNMLAVNVYLTDTLPAGLSVDETSIPPTHITGQHYVWSLGALTPTFGSVGVPGQIVITTTVGGPGGRLLLNEVNATGQPTSPTYKVFPGDYSLETWVRIVTLYLPIITKRYSP